MMKSKNNCAIAVRNCSKSFSNCRGKLFRIWEELNLTVPCGTIYALLGSSGCGKTSLIRAVLGQMKLDNGEIWILEQKTSGMLPDGATLSNIGYMPQDICLYDMLSIRETLAFYGGIQGLSQEVLKERTEFYINYLKLPTKHTINRNLSVGQRRRVSFAASIIHHPKLLILDEPTVGLDPIIRLRIWQLMHNMVITESVSILLTTHFIEEAENANIIGMLHGNRLQVEATPDMLLASLSCFTLEDAFLRICSGVVVRTEGGALSDTDTHADTLDLTMLAPRSDAIACASERHVADEKRHSNSVSRFRQIATLIQKNMIQLCRFPAALLIVLALPSFILVVFCSALTKFEALQLAVRTSDTGPFGDMYFDMFEPEIAKQTRVASIEDGIEAVTSGRQLAFININENFTSFMQDLLSNEFRFSQLSDNASNLANCVYVYLNGVDYPLNLLVKYHSSTSILKLCLAAANYMGVTNLTCKPPITLQETLNGEALISIPIREFFIPGILIMISYFVAFHSTVASFFLEKKNGYLERGSIAGVSPLDSMISHIVVATAIIIFQTVGAMLVSFVVYEAPLNGSLMLASLILWWTAVCGMSAGFMISSLTDELHVICIIAYAWLFCVVPLSGWINPISAMPKPLLIVSYSLPFALPIQALIGITQHGWGPFNHNVLNALAVTTVWLTISNGITYYIMKAKRTQAKTK